MSDRFAIGIAALGRLPLYELVPMFVLPGIFIGGLAVFCLRSALYGMPRSPRVAKVKQTLLPRMVLEFGIWFFDLPVRGLAAVGVSPDSLTITSGLLALVSAFYCALGHMLLGGWLLYLSFIFDLLDGAVARKLGISSDRGEFLDALVDRYADFFLSLGFMWYYRDDPLPLALVALGMIGASVMGYARAKGEAVGIDPNVGWLQRHERAVVIGTGTVFSPIVSAFVEPSALHPRFPLLILALGIAAFFTNLSAVWRGVYVLRRMPARPAPAPAGRVATRHDEEEPRAA